MFTFATLRGVDWRGAKVKRPWLTGCCSSLGERLLQVGTEVVAERILKSAWV